MDTSLDAVRAGQSAVVEVLLPPISAQVLGTDLLASEPQGDKP